MGWPTRVRAFPRSYDSAKKRKRAVPPGLVLLARTRPGPLTGGRHVMGPRRYDLRAARSDTGRRERRRAVDQLRGRQASTWVDLRGVRAVRVAAVRICVHIGASSRQQQAAAEEGRRTSYLLLVRVELRSEWRHHRWRRQAARKPSPERSETKGRSLASRSHSTLDDVVLVDGTPAPTRILPLQRPGPRCSTVCSKAREGPLDPIVLPLHRTEVEGTIPACRGAVRARWKRSSTESTFLIHLRGQQLRRAARGVGSPGSAPRRRTSASRIAIANTSTQSAS